MFKVLFIAGPTATGKTEYAIKLAQDLNGEIVSADSMQIYKYMDIGSAKPTKEEQAMAKHWLIDEIDPRNPFNVSDYQKLAKKYIYDIKERGKLPIVCGGTGLYLNSLIYDMDFSAPEGDSSYRDELIAKYQTPDKLFSRLRELDPNAGNEEDKNNLKRIARYIERLEKGEKTLAEFSETNKPSLEFSPIICVLNRNREELYNRIDQRVDLLVKAGLVDEVNNLIAMGFTKNDIAMKGIGYKELMDELPLDEAINKIKLNTRHYAKRQITWFKQYKEKGRWFDLGQDSYEAILKYIKEQLSE